MKTKILHIFLLLASILAVAAQDEEKRLKKRQSSVQYPAIYYICGEFPNLVYTLTRMFWILTILERPRPSKD